MVVDGGAGKRVGGLPALSGREAAAHRVTLHTRVTFRRHTCMHTWVDDAGLDTTDWGPNVTAWYGSGAERA